MEAMDMDQNGAGARNDGGIDTDLYSRQIYVLGMETMKKLGATSVLVVGLKGLGTEIAKNVALAGPKAITVVDDGDVEMGDLAAQFYFSEADIGKRRSDVCAPKLAQLNSHVTLQARSGIDVTDGAFLSEFQVVVMSGVPLDTMLAANKFCHEHGIAFIAADAAGVTGTIFTDFGEQFTVFDDNGEEPLEAIVTSISNENPGIVTVHDDKRHDFQTGDVVTFSEVKGMGEVNGPDRSRPIKVTGPYSFTIEDTTGYSAYESGGVVRQVKVPKTVPFKSLSESLAQPGELLVSDFAKMDGPAQLHVFYQALHAFRASHGGRVPAAGNETEARQVAELCNEVNERAKAQNASATSSDAHVHVVDELDDNLMFKLALHAAADVSPMASFLGGIAAQEVVKACSGKFMPIHQWLHFDARECLPENIDPAELAPVGSRFDGQIAMLGRSLQEKLMNLNSFLVGAGAIGCEYLKLFACMGIGCGPKGLLTVTDMDQIERSNLNRQFLFRDGDIGEQKSVAACNAAKAMNPQMNLRALTIPVGGDTEDTFNEEFWDSMDIIFNALDNVKARLYVDGKCVLHEKPLLESGTLGTKGNVQVVIPHMTESYGASQDPPERSIPMCTLKNFPHAIEHTIEWARDVFGGYFLNPLSESRKYIDNADYVETLVNSNQNAAVKIEILRGVRDTLTAASGATFDDCVVWAREKFEDLFSNQVKQLLFNFPKDHITSEGTPFWSGPKRAPSPLQFDAGDPTHVGFVVAAANLRAFALGVPQSRDVDAIRAAAAQVKVQDFAPKSNVKIFTRDEEADEAGASGAAAMDEEDNEDAHIAELVKQLPDRASLQGAPLQPVEFEKDDDSNFHMDFITATANLRARNYEIAEADFHKCKQIAGRIIPAIATTTAMVVGLAGLEIYKILQQCDIEKFKNAFANLALPFWGFSEPIPPQKHASDEATKYYPEGWTQWSRIDAPIEDKTVQGLLDFLQNKHGLTASLISAGSCLLYNAFMPKPERLQMKVTELYEMLTKAKLRGDQKYLYLEAGCEDADGADVEMPTIRYFVH